MHTAQGFAGDAYMLVGTVCRRLLASYMEQVECACLSQASLMFPPARHGVCINITGAMLACVVKYVPCAADCAQACFCSAGSADQSEEVRAWGQNPSVPSFAQMADMSDAQPLNPGSAASSIDPNFRSTSLHALGGTWTIPFRELVSCRPCLFISPLRCVEPATVLTPAAVIEGPLSLRWLRRVALPCVGVEEADWGGQHRQGAPGQVAGDRRGCEDPQQPVQHRRHRGRGV